MTFEQVQKATYLTYMGQYETGKLVHWEHWSNPDAETYLTGIDYYDHPRECRLAMRRLYPFWLLPIPASDAPKPRPLLDLSDGHSSNPERHTVRWGDGESGSWEHGTKFRSTDEVFRFSPLEYAADHTDWVFGGAYGDVWNDVQDKSIEDRLKRVTAPGLAAQPETPSMVSFYNTMFMWPLLTFGWENFLACCLDPRFERIMKEFAEINRRVFRTLARLPVNVILCHDDIVMTRGLVCSPQWMRQYIYPAYEEQWAILKAGGKRVIFMSDGNTDPVADDVMACGATGIWSEPYGNYKAYARKFGDIFLAGEGDNRILQTCDRAAIRNMVSSMVETSRLSKGYLMCVGNHIPWNVPGEAVKLYLEYSGELAYR